MVGIGGLCGSSPVANQKQIHDLLSRLSFELSHTCHDNTFLRIISQLQVPGRWHKQISNHFVVDFDIGDDDVVLVVRIFVDIVEDIPNGEDTT